jgi:serine phosphatase RsbU (regulator of sigma subunit)
LGETVEANRNEDPEELVAAVLAALGRFAGVRQHDDDLTIVAMKLTATVSHTA